MIASIRSRIICLVAAGCSLRAAGAMHGGSNVSHLRVIV